MEPNELGPETQQEATPATSPTYQPSALAREGMLYRVNTRTVLWLIVLAVVLSLTVWWAST
jgi:hypothetical protein